MIKSAGHLRLGKRGRRALLFPHGMQNSRATTTLLVLRTNSSNLLVCAANFRFPTFYGALNDTRQCDDARTTTPMVLTAPPAAEVAQRAAA